MKELEAAKSRATRWKHFQNFFGRLNYQKHIFSIFGVEKITSFFDGNGKLKMLEWSRHGSTLEFRKKFHFRVSNDSNRPDMTENHKPNFRFEDYQPLLRTNQSLAITNGLS